MTTPSGPPYGPPYVQPGPPYGQPPHSGPPLPYGPPAQPYPASGSYHWYPPQPPGPRSGRTKWIVVAVIAALTVTLGVGAVAWKVLHGNKKEDPVATAPMADLLLKRNELYPILYPEGNPEPGWPDPSMDKPLAQQTNPPQCTSAVITGSATAYTPGSYIDFAMRPAWIGVGLVNQTAVRFDSAKTAAAFRDRQVDTWKRCSGQTATVDNKRLSDPQVHIGAVDSSTDVITLEVQNGHLGQPCQRAMKAVSNVVIEAETCMPDHPVHGTHKTARDVVGEIVARIH